LVANYLSLWYDVKRGLICVPSIFDNDFKPDPEEDLGTPSNGRSNKRDLSLSKFDVSTGRKTLGQMVNIAFDTLQEAMEKADFNTAVKAAQILLDRAGFGPKTTVDINSTHTDLTDLTREQLAQRAAELSERLKEKEVKAITVN
jgi:hypothetical protein